MNAPYDDGCFNEEELLLDDYNIDGPQHHFYNLKDQEVFQQDAVPLEFEGCHATPQKSPEKAEVHKQIPKIALNFTKWKLQQRMTTDLRKITDPEEITQKLAKYTECFDLLDRLGADNCVDPDDFDQEDMNDELFKNLTIADIEELFKENNTPKGIIKTIDQDSLPAIPAKDCSFNSKLEDQNKAFSLCEEDAFLLDYQP